MRTNHREMQTIVSRLGTTKHLWPRRIEIKEKVPAPDPVLIEQLVADERQNVGGCGIRRRGPVCGKVVGLPQLPAFQQPVGSSGYKPAIRQQQQTADWRSVP